MRRTVKMQRQTAKILIIGLGQIGQANAEYMTQRGLSVDGYDIDKSAVKRALAAKVIRREAKTFKGYDYYIICVSTHDPNDIAMPCFNNLLETSQRLYKEGTEGSLVIIESTVSKGICSMVHEILEHKLHVAHVPHRFYAKEKEEHGVRQIRVLGGCRDCCTEAAVDFYKDALDIPIHRVGSVEVAALSKVVENSYRFLQIAFAEELKLFCDCYGLDFEELREAVNTKWNTKLLEAKEGIGGHCLPKDTRMYLDLSKKALPFSIIDSAIQINEKYRAKITMERDFLTIPTVEAVVTQES
jgi:UDP-N-acetyl-D-mannosaminuronic acid dehydrogenase